MVKILVSKNKLIAKSIYINHKIMTSANFGDVNNLTLICIHQTNIRSKATKFIKLKRFLLNTPVSFLHISWKIPVKEFL